MSSETATMTTPVAAADAGSGAVAIRPAGADEAQILFQLITDNLEVGHLLPRPLGEVVLHVPRFLVAAGPDGIAGCAELAQLGPRVAEVRSLVVGASHRRHGIGRLLLSAIVARAREQGYPRLCAFTHDPRPFIRIGFSIVPHQWVPEKIATDCHDCTWFRRCRQYAVILDLQPKAGRP